MGPHPSTDSVGLATLAESRAVGDPARVADALVQHFPRIWRLAHRIGLGAEEAEEVAQEAFVVMLQRLDAVEAGKELGFLLSTATFLCRNYRRKASQRCEVPHAPELLERVAQGPTTLELLERKQARDLLDSILATLSDRLRTVFVLHELEQLTLQEIAQLLDIPPNTASSRLRLAREAFKAELERRKRPITLAEEP